MLKLIFSLLALVVAFIMVFILPGSGFETVAITLIASIAGSFGIIDWRLKYDEIKSWLGSKTIWGALLIIIPVLLVILLPIFGIILPTTVLFILNAIIVAGGGTVLIGIISAANNKAKKLNN